MVEKCEKCNKTYPETGRWYKKGRIIKGNEIIELAGKLCGDCYDRLNEKEKTEWIFELENFGTK